MGTDIYGVLLDKGKRELIGDLQDINLDDRNYRLYGCIAGVRDEFCIEPIAEERGIPEYVQNLLSELRLLGADSLSSLTYDQYLKSFGRIFGSYGHTYFTLDEVIDRFKDKLIVGNSGYIRESNYLALDGKIKPKEYRSYVWGVKTTKIHYKRYEDIKDDINEGMNVYIYAEWEEPYINEYMMNWMSRAKDVCKGRDYKDCLFVVGFSD